MNANELADELHKIYIQEAAECWDVVEEAATMLRQQQAEIEKLKVEKIRTYDNGYEDGRKSDTNPKPAETLTDDPLVNFKPVWQEKPELTLTDEEIEQIGKEYGIKSVYQFAYYEFARAILRKAQEK